jgi:Ca-activated chloride channel family protein
MVIVPGVSDGLAGGKRGSPTMFAAAAILLASAAATGSDRIAVTSRLVMIPVTVTDRGGAAIPNLDREHFQVTEDSERRAIVALTREDGPASIGIVLDWSGSMRPAASDALAAARAVAETAEDGDEVFLMTFGDRPELRVPLTRDPRAVFGELRGTRAHGGTALVDAIWQALEEARESSLPRRSLVVISDGGENASRHRIAELKRAAIEADTRIHSIALYAGYRKDAPSPRPWILEELAELTGGLHFTIHHSGALPETAARLARAMKEVYVIAYRPSVSEPGKWRRVRVTVMPPDRRRVRVAARAGYHFPE